MQSNELEKLFGKSRVQRYKNTQEDWLSLCEKNIDISESFYRKIYIFEIFLRNRIDIEFTKKFGGNWLVLDKTNINFQERGIEKIKEVHKRFKNTDITHSIILENLTFVFWVGLFHGYYNRQVWEKHKMIECIFPHIHAQERGLDVIQKDIDTIRKLRNKIFYFADVLNTDFEEVEVLLTKYTKAIYNGQDFLI
ncbi:MAG: hypothetical protein ACI9CD_000108 [Candidatus Deianiraeaceae bacterium]|jgi:hypothetical protein